MDVVERRRGEKTTAEGPTKRPMVETQVSDILVNPQSSEPSGKESPTYRDITYIKIAIILKSYPNVNLK